ncbi:hypothetical protein M1L59_13405, partial [Acinetobacter schindleri]|nr:hypothetical protein [Acinetobacter schindleri]
RRIGIEHVFGSLKTFKILAERYRNRGKRLGLRFNLIAGIYNLRIVVANHYINQDTSSTAAQRRSYI